MDDSDNGRRFAVQREVWRWRTGEPCPKCAEWIGHFGGSTTRDPCPLIPDNVPLDELRPNCYAAKWSRIADAIRAATTRAACRT